MLFPGLAGARRIANGFGAAFVAIAWVLAALAYAALPASIGTHFDAAGHADQMGPKATLWAVPAIATLLFALLIVVQRMDPRNYNLPFKIAPEARERAGTLQRLMIAILCALTAATFIGVELMAVAPAFSLSPTEPIAIVWTCTILIFATIASVTVVLWRTCR